MRFAQIVLLVLLSSCRDTTIPPAPVLGPGTVRATLVTVRAGRANPVPAQGARVSLVGTTQFALSDADGNVTLGDLHATAGQLRFEYDADGDGVAEYARLTTLEAAHAGFGKDVNLGQLTLGRTGTVIGVVRREGAASPSSGNGGIAVFIPQLPQLTFTGDDGSFVLSGLPEGDCVLSASATGYHTETLSLVLDSGEERRLSPITLRADPGAPTSANLTGRVSQPDDTPLEGVTVRVFRAGAEVRQQTSSDGTFLFPNQPIGLATLGLEKSGLTPLRVDNVLIEGPLTTVGPYVLTPGSGQLGPLDGGLTPFDAGMADGDAGSDAGLDAGLDAGFDAGPTGPLAVVGLDQLVLPGTVVTLDGTASSGDQPLTYAWTALPPNALVQVTPNGTVTSHSPTFTSPGVGSVLEFSLVVTDRQGRPSTNSAVARVAVGGTPTARFGPDGGAFPGSSVVTLASTSFDDAGLALVNFSWAQVPPVSGANLSTDGGLAVLTLPAVPQGNAPVLVGVELTVTNSIGARSAPARQTYVANPGNGTNWSLSASLAGTSPVLANGSNPPARLLPAVTTGVASPSISYAWQCTGISPVITVSSTGEGDFAVPLVAGPDVNAVCQVTATGAPPLSPAQLTATVSFLVRDALNPVVLSSRPGSSSLRSSPFGMILRTSERVTDSNTSNCGGVLLTEQVGAAAVFFTNVLVAANTCGAWTGIISDLATPPNSLGNITIAPSFTVGALWQGPLASTARYDDPRPAVVTAGPLPFETQAASNPPPVPPLPYEVTARDGVNLVTFGVDVLSPPTGCNPDCPITGTATPLPGLDSTTPPPLNTRVAWVGAELLVAMQQRTDAGSVDTLYARRSGAGAWSALPVTGELYSDGTTTRRIRIVDGGVYSDVFDPFTTSFGFAELVTVLGPDAGVVQVSAGESKRTRRASAVSVYRSLTGTPTVENFWRTPATASWTSFGGGAVQNFISGVPVEGTVGFNPTVVAMTARNASPGLGTYGSSFSALNSLGPVTGGFDVIHRQDTNIIAVSQGGDLRLYTWVLIEGGGGPTEFPGPPRTVPLAPGDNRLDIDTACEAAWPRLALVEDALVVTWQERCGAETTWRVVMRIIQ